MVIQQTAPYLMPDVKELRQAFELMHAGRNLTRHPLRGTYNSPPIAALWNQHLRTVNWLYTGSTKKPLPGLFPTHRLSV
jgi:hypothetical protein